MTASPNWNVLLLAGLALALVVLILFPWGVGRAVGTVVPRQSNTLGKRLFAVLWVGALAAGAILLFAPSSRRVSAPTTTKPMGRMSVGELQKYATERSFVAVAAAGQKVLDAEHGKLAPTAPVSVPVGVHDDHPATQELRPGMAVRIARVRSDPHSSRDRALASALAKAQVKLTDQLQAFDPPVATVPSVELIRREYLRPDTVTDVTPTPELKAEWKNAGLSENLQLVEIDVEVSDRQLRDLRARDRATDGGLVAAAALAAFASLFGFLRLDAWTKGYLTTALGFGAAAMVGGAVAFLAWVR